VSLRDLTATTKVSPALEDAVLVVYPERLALICTPAAYDEVMPRLALWGSALEVHCCTEDELQDPDLQEAFKLRSFVAVMASVRRVRAPLFRSALAPSLLPSCYRSLLALSLSGLCLYRRPITYARLAIYRRA